MIYNSIDTIVTIHGMKTPSNHAVSQRSCQGLQLQIFSIVKGPKENSPTYPTLSFSFSFSLLSSLLSLSLSLFPFPSKLNTAMEKKIIKKEVILLADGTATILNFHMRLL